MTRTRLLVPAALFVASAILMAFFLSWKLARADDVPQPGPAVAVLFDAGPAGPADAAPTPPAAVPPVPPDPESDVLSFLRIVWAAGKQSVPAAAVFVFFGLVTVVRRRWPPAREGTTGVLTATLLTALTYAVSMIATGAPWGSALGGALIALLTGKALAMQPVKSGMVR